MSDQPYVEPGLPTLTHLAWDVLSCPFMSCLTPAWTKQIPLTSMRLMPKNTPVLVNLTDTHAKSALKSWQLWKYFIMNYYSLIFFILFCFALSGFYKIFQRQFIYAKIIYTIYVVCVKELYRLNYQCLVDTLLGLILHINHNIKWCLIFNTNLSHEMYTTVYNLLVLKTTWYFLFFLWIPEK